MGRYQGEPQLEFKCFCAMRAEIGAVIHEQLIRLMIMEKGWESGRLKASSGCREGQKSLMAG